jgi:hypothetical protein
MAHIERRRIRQADGSGRVRVVTRYRVRYRDESGRQHCDPLRAGLLSNTTIMVLLILIGLPNPPKADWPDARAAFGLPNLLSK